MQQRSSVFTVLSVIAPAVGGVLGLWQLSSASSGGFLDLRGLAAAICITGGVAAGLVFTGIAAWRRERPGWRIGLAACGVLLGCSLSYGSFATWRREREEKRTAMAQAWGASGGITDFAVLSDGRVVIVGGGVVRLMPDGSVDPSFRRDTRYTNSYARPLGASLIGEPWCVDVNPDGSLLIMRGNEAHPLRPDGMEAGTPIPAPRECVEPHNVPGFALTRDGKLISTIEPGFRVPELKVYSD